MNEPLVEAALLAYPMHGQSKLLQEGYRTRDGHFIEWFGRLLADRGGVNVVSRPEPVYKMVTRRSPASNMATGTRSTEIQTWMPPNPFNRRAWWRTSAAYYPRLTATPTTVAAIVWNPFVALTKKPSNPFADGRTTVLDLLDDWTVHYAFQSIKSAVDNAYRSAFAHATHVTANAEGTAALACRYGRDDVILMTNGCDPERFSTKSRASGRLTVGYVGKIGRRLDLDNIVYTAQSLPQVEFVFAGPILDSEYRAPLQALDNVTLLGDVHYRDVPTLLETFDVGWVPHFVGSGEVGGDVIKTYEYRAAGLPVLTTPIAGASSRGLDHVIVLPAHEHAQWIEAAVRIGQRVERTLPSIPPAATWRHKALDQLGLLGLEHRA